MLDPGSIESKEPQKHAEEYIPSEREPIKDTAVKGVIAEQLNSAGRNKMFYVQARNGRLVSVLRLNRFDYSDPKVGDAVVAYLNGGANYRAWRACKRPTDQSPQQST